MEEVSARTQLSKIRDYEKGFFAMHLINIGAKLGIFDALYSEEGGMTATDLAVRLGLDESYLKVWCKAAYHFEILDCDREGRFSFEPFMDEILGDRSSLRNYTWNVLVNVAGGNFLASSCDNYRTGEAFDCMYTPEFSSMVGEGTRNIFLAFLYLILPKNEDVKLKLEEGSEVLDVGCGSGSLIIQLAQNFEKSKFVGIDPDGYGIEEARKQIADLGLKDRVSVENIGGEELPFEKEFDLATLVLSLHEIPPQPRVETVPRVYRALRHGGQLVVLDFPFPNTIEEFRDDAFEHAIHDQFWEFCTGVVHLTSDERYEMLEGAGFSNLRKTAIGKGMFELVVADKP